MLNVNCKFGHVRVTEAGIQTTDEWDESDCTRFDLGWVLQVLRTVTRLRVGTRARARSARRVGLTFETLTLQQPALLGLDVSTRMA